MRKIVILSACLLLAPSVYASPVSEALDSVWSYTVLDPGGCLVNWLTITVQTVFCVFKGLNPANLVP